MLHVFGHKNPDSDSICTALVTADWLNGQGRTAQAFALGTPIAETRFILETAGVEAPPVFTGSVADKPVFLVDFSELEQGPEGLADADVQGLIDHHRIGTLITRGPLDAWVRAVGCSATVLLELMGYDDLSRAQARLLLGAIVSDTFNFTSPTTTAQDRLAVERLLPIADLSLAPFAQTLLERRTQIGDMPLCEALVADEKAYQIAGHSLMVSQICVMNPAEIEARTAELYQAMTDRLTRDKLDGYVLMLTDLAKGNSQLFFASKGLLPADPVQLAGAVSRKKEGLPWLASYFA
ncbi:DHHA2 domain-containing protein [Aeromonas lusitana]|uniref:Pyrophosphatase n=1 Tax=Aeromonas lusitana TaxID=931529 RepID=A0A2M8HA15_9GAMM|nr:DHHA2 domain-containing protein [Aeromonas lusitana]PJC93399.1 pyrophosphatase [Aeromonas lusitana]